MECYSVESLYYNLEVVKKIAKRISEVTGNNETELYEKATSEIISSIQPHKERLCSRLCEKQVRNSAMTSLPKHKDILERGSFNFSIDLREAFDKEGAVFDKMIADKNYNGLLNRYPVRETPVLTKIATALGLNCDKYESSVRKLIIDDEETKEFYKTLLIPLTKLISE